MPSFMKLQSWWRSLHFWQRFAWLCWGMLLVFVSIRAACVNPSRGSVFPIYASAATDWVHGADMYTLDFSRPCYRYHPLVSAFFVPWQVLPTKVDAIVWRWLGLALLLAGITAWARRLAEGPISPVKLSLFSLLVFPFALQSFNNAQANVHLIALLLLGLEAAERGRWWLCCGLVTAATILKAYPIAVGMLLMVSFPRQFALRYLVCLGLAFAAPYLMQRPDYVTSQYDLWFRYLQHDDRHSLFLDEASRDAYMLVQVWLQSPSPRMYQLVQVLAGGVFAAICLWGTWAGASRRLSLMTGLNLGCVWMTAFGPSTESCTYTILGPTLAALIISPASVRSRVGGYLAILCYLMVVSPVFAMMVGQSRRIQQLGVQPAGAILLIAVILEDLVRSIRGASISRLSFEDNRQADTVTRAAA